MWNTYFLYLFYDCNLSSKLSMKIITINKTYKNSFLFLQINDGKNVPIEELKPKLLAGM